MGSWAPTSGEGPRLQQEAGSTFGRSSDSAAPCLARRCREHGTMLAPGRCPNMVLPDRQRDPASSLLGHPEGTDASALCEGLIIGAPALLSGCAGGEPRRSAAAAGAEPPIRGERTPIVLFSIRGRRLGRLRSNVARLRAVLRSKLGCGGRLRGSLGAAGDVATAGRLPSSRASGTVRPRA